jgi:dihydrofolate reductase
MKPYIDYQFIGIRSFTALLEEAGRSYEIINDAAIPMLFRERKEYFNSTDDEIVMGKCMHEAAAPYFAEFAIGITPRHKSRIVFVFDHRPTADEMLRTADDIEGLVMSHLERVDFGDIAGSGRD